MKGYGPYQFLIENILHIGGSTILKNFAKPYESPLIEALESIIKIAPFRYMKTPRGHRMSVAMTNCGTLGWITDHKGYRYETKDPESGYPWPAMPEIFLYLGRCAATQAGFIDFKPDSCLINLYEPGTKLSLHQDKDESDFSAPIVSVSLGLQATFLFGGTSRKDVIHKIPLIHGDIVVFGGQARLAYHGIMPIKKGFHPLLGEKRINLTFRKVR